MSTVNEASVTDKDSGTSMTEQIEITTLQIDQVFPNDYNPNRMTEAEFGELVAEVRHLSRLPKPVVVRLNGHAGYTIVDGEHGWHAAKEAGLPSIPCEIIEADNFEAMRQTYKRNQHGTHNPVQLGRMFQKMLAVKGISRRELAKEMEVSEGTVRNALIFAEAAEVRNDYAWETLSVKQVRLYHALPRAIGDLWLAHGAKVKELFPDQPENVVETALDWEEKKHRSPLGMKFSFYERLADEGIIQLLPKGIGGGFKGMVDAAKRAEGWEWKWVGSGIKREQLRPYTKFHFSGECVVRDRTMMDSVLGILIDTTTQLANFRLTPEEFENVLKGPSRSALDFEQSIKAAIIKKGGTLPEKPWKAADELKTAEIERYAPAYIKTSPLKLPIKYALWKAEGDEDMKEYIASKQYLRGDDPKNDPRDVVRWEMNRVAKEHWRQQMWNTASPMDLAKEIANRMPLYDQKKHRREFLELAQKLSALTKAELMVLNEYTADMDKWRISLEQLQNLGKTIRSF